MDIQSSGSSHVKSSDNSRKFNVPSQIRNGWNLVCTTVYTKFYFIWTSMAWDIADWRLLIQSYLLPTWRLATSLDLSAIPELEYLQTQEVVVSWKLTFGYILAWRIWKSHLKSLLRICGNVTLKSYELDCVYVALSLKC